MLDGRIAWELVIAVLISVVGWVVTHRKQLAAQKEQLRHQILNQARVEITDSIREYQQWLTWIAANLLSASKFSQDGPDVTTAWKRRYSELAQHFSEGSTCRNWLTTLEEYDVLFPEVRGVRKDLAERQKELERRIRSLLGDLRMFVRPPGSIERLSEVEENLKPVSEFVLDQAALMEDLRIHLQNRALGEIAGQEAPGRDPQDPGVPKLIYRGGKLEISQGIAPTS